MAEFDLDGRTAIVTGGSRGIGLAIGRKLADCGASVAVTSRKQDAADAAAKAIGRGAIGIGAHATDAAAAQRCVDEVMQRFGRVDILVNNAGTNPAYGAVIDQDHGRFEKIFDVNLWAPILWTKLAVSAWMDGHGGAIVNTASIGGLKQDAGLGLYGATKAALIYLTKQMAMELSPGIRVNAVCPGVVRTRLAEALWKDHEKTVAAATAADRIGEPADVAGAVAFLVSDAASWITGEAMVIDGGQRLGDVRSFRRPARD